MPEGAQARGAEEPIRPEGQWEVVNHGGITSLNFGVISYTAIDNWSLPYEWKPSFFKSQPQGLLSPS